MTYSDDELTQMLVAPESAHVERKSLWTRETSTKAREAVCAFANDLSGSGKPGVLFVGAEDDGTPSGLVINDRLLLQLAEMRTDGNILPLPTLHVERRRLNGGDVAVVTVAPSDAPPVRYRGRIWVRSGPRRVLASAQDERILSERRRFADQPYDTRPVYGADVTALSILRFEQEYLPRAFAPDVLAANERSVEERLAATKMILSIFDPVPTVVGLLTLARQPDDYIPGAYVQTIRWAGTDRSAPVNLSRRDDGPIAQLVERAEFTFSALSATAVNFDGPTERRQHLYPPVAFEQLFRNAVMHRNYDHSHAPIRVDMYTDRVEIVSPGGPFGDVTAETLPTGLVNSYRNKALAAVMRDLGLVQGFGAGIAKARAALAANGSPPLEFDIRPNVVTAILRPRLDYADFPAYPKLELV